ncbi:undecaprenyldiphospho-muramoylpentapeptide beta-N-acetylglucosaminyltransferase [Halorhodospira halochloris]|uniref:undecaprenyldiphospho-muramoylpentapeptide beta-N-acetylglucosaminyltransferase n=1 Tax=Halorhodospira halochloris TaxID=1052 RepID=UPI001EE8D652|nr:undecaprenyldiphospho-muramoylpentapeptide beta-N-acetylglucosaminyltransferase [Halorhodospira halochloris]MCG5529570.1 undecaprenyldiphospho-muramoylpentapeptide beta-N-acetylglucosaminyltransferase [Halorhodospira halochloris]MCG5548151.1 undecaprenyldiphospho-muramoylpentapeptide beta-N-acetylglucosaminyltransferase [Halorhodospira halochloris]
MSNPTVAIAAGGTGGHVYPGLAVAEVLRNRGCNVVWIGTRYGLEGQVVPPRQLPVEWLHTRALRGKGLGAKLVMPWRLTRSVYSATRILAKHKPDVVLGMGAYIAGPVGVAAALRRTPLVIHEQNAIAGLANRMLAPMCKRVLTGFPNVMSGRGEYVGNPVRSEITRLVPPEQRYARRQGPPRLLILGGSQGAQALNRAVPAAMAKWPADLPMPRIVHQSGEKTMHEAQEGYRQAGIEVEVVPFVEDMAGAYEWADLVVARSGALTVAELAAAGSPAVLIPLPWAVDDHQRYNAELLGQAGGARVLPQAAIENGQLATLLPQLLGDRQRLQLQKMGEAARSVAVSDAAERVAQICLEECK